ncbi:MAG: hypothetical protein JWP84_1504 [Tardiphaga sp.]|jgi:hypothetical protein|nr:hypothetical protein [Tardiphaga sp.]MDB5633617.1 hypothetical protein [Tardiphaga sp.]
MRIAIVLVSILALMSPATCQTGTKSDDKKPGDSQYSTGRTVLPESNKGRLQPQGWTGPITTESGGAPADSPQGQSPPGMQAAPDGASKTIVETK